MKCLPTRLLVTALIPAMLWLIPACGMGPEQNVVCGPIKLFNEDRTILFGFDPLMETAHVGHLDFNNWDKYTHRVEVTSDVVIVEYYQQTAGRDDENVHHVWHNLFGYRYNRKTKILVAYNYRLGDVKTGTREELLEKRMAQQPLIPDWEQVWEPCRPEPFWRALIGRFVTLLYRV